MGSGAETQVLATAPVGEVVLAAIARLGPVRNLVVFVGGLLQPLLSPLVLVGLRIRVRAWRPASGDIACERRARLYRQRIQRDVVWL